MAQKNEANQQERPLQSFTFKDFWAINTTAARVACPAQAFYDLENAQPIGASNLHSVQDISAQLANYGADLIYYDKNVNIAGVEYLIQASTTGKLFAYNVATQAVTQINGAATLSGSGTRITQWNNTNALIIDPTGYFQWPGSGNIATVTGTGTPSNGSCIAVYQGQVWITQGRLLSYSVPGSFSDFTPASGAGSTALVDPTLHSSVVELLAANGYLYIFGTSSIDAISDVYLTTVGSTNVTNFTKLNITAIIGTDQPYSIYVYGRLVFFANRYGCWNLYGTSVISISSPDVNNNYNSSIDGTYQYVDFSQTISGGTMVSNNLFCAAFLLKRTGDPAFGSGVIIAIYQGNAAGGRWWFANWSTTGPVSRITTALVNNQPSLFGYIGNKLYQFFAVAGSSPPATMQSALWDFGDPLTEKQVIKAGIGITVFVRGSGLNTFTLDTQSVSLPITFNNSPGQITWINNANTPVGWINNLSAPVVWIPTFQYLTYWGQGAFGFSKFVGLTVTTTQGMVFELNSFLMDYKWAARWVGQ